MKKFMLFLVLVLFALLNCSHASAQNFKREGNTFVAVSSRSNGASSDTKTSFTWRDSKGKEYPIWISKGGSCYVIRTSSKTGKEYKNYLGKELSAEVRKAMGRPEPSKTSKQKK